MTRRLLSVSLALWTGSLWTICAIVAPSLFAIMPDRHLAGELAAHFFRIESWLGLAFGGFTLALLARITALRTTSNKLLVVVTAATPLLSEIALQPFMERARAGGDMRTFGLLHGAAALLFGVACVTALLLVWQVSVNRPAE